MKINPAHILLEKHLVELGLKFEREIQFHPHRKWKFDYVLRYWLNPLSDVAIEIEGGVYRSAGRHLQISGYQGDLDKYNVATMMGYRLLRFSTADVLRGRARAFLKHYLFSRPQKEDTLPMEYEKPPKKRRKNS